MEVRVARLDTCAKPSHIVGFSITHPAHQKSIYLDAFVPLDECPVGTPQQEIAKKGWTLIKPAAEAWIEELDKKETSIVGSVFDPSQL